jgi:hypothetical protein
LMIHDISSGHGGTLADDRESWDRGFYSSIYCMSIDRRRGRVAFYASDTIAGVVNLEMPPPRGNICCYVADMTGGRTELLVAPHPQDPLRPLPVVVPPDSGMLNQIQSFNTGCVFYHPPTINAAGNRVAFTAGLEMGSSDTGVYVFEPERRRSHVVIHFDGHPGAGPGEQTLETGVAPSISPDGRYIAYRDRRVTFPEGFGSPREELEEGRTYCPTTVSDELVVQRLPRGESSPLLGATEDPLSAPRTGELGVACAEDGAQVAFLSRSNKELRNPDYVEQVYYAVRLE